MRMPRLIIEIDQNGSLFYILDAFLGAYNRRSEIIARSAGIPADEIAEETAVLNNAATTLETALHKEK